VVSEFRISLARCFLFEIAVAIYAYPLSHPEINGYRTGVGAYFACCSTNCSSLEANLACAPSLAHATCGVHNRLGMSGASRG
jgi:hypothetical protein